MSEYDGFTGLDLLEMGTRLDHYDELREVFMIGVELLKGLNPLYRSEVDISKQTRLQNAADEIAGRIDMLAKFRVETAYGGSFREDIELLHRNPRLLLTERVKHVNQADGSDAEGEGAQANP